MKLIIFNIIHHTVFLTIFMALIVIVTRLSASFRKFWTTVMKKMKISTIMEQMVLERYSRKVMRTGEPMIEQDNPMMKDTIVRE